MGKNYFSPACGGKGLDVGDNGKGDGYPNFQLFSLYSQSRKVISLHVNIVWAIIDTAVQVDMLGT